MRKFKNYFLGLVLVLMLIVLVACTNSEHDVNNKQDVANQNGMSDDTNQVQNEENNGDEKIIKKIDGVKKLGDIEISDIQIELIEKGRCRVTGKVKNTSDKDLPSTSVSIRVLNESGDTGKVFGAIIPELIWFEESQFVTYVWSDITDAHDIEISEVKEINE